MSRGNRALIRTDASPLIGGGHVVRCLALAEALTADGWSVEFVGIRETLDTMPSLARAGYNFTPVSRPDDPAELMAIKPGGYDLLVVDHYGLDARFEEACRPWAGQILAIDDLANRHHCCDFLLDQSLDRKATDYAGMVSPSGRLLLGPGYALLRSAFAVEREQAGPRGDAAKRILVSMGATDASGKLPSTIEALSELSIELDVVVGSAAQNLAEIGQIAKATGARLHIETCDMARLMMEADIAILAAGSTTWEAACLGLPMVLVVSADNQRGVARAMMEKGAAVAAKNLDAILATIVQLLENTQERRRLMRTAAKICDGRGAQRAVIALRPEQAADSRAISLRRADHEDAELILHWQSHPMTRKFSRHQEVPDRATHMAWIDRKLGDPGCLFNVLMYENEPAGVLRLDRHENSPSVSEISIFVAPDLHRRGIGGAALRLAQRLVPGTTFLANVLSGNAPSLKLFERAGYRSIGNGWFSQAPITQVLAS